MIYLSSTTGLPEEYLRHFGVMFTSRNSVGGLASVLDSGWPWMMDSGAFAGKFTEDNWISGLGKYSAYSSTCVGIPVPDTLGDWSATLDMFHKYRGHVVRAGYPVAIVSQDGSVPESVDWSLVDTLFVGGTDAHKLGPEAMTMIDAARANGKRVHIGRVNSAKRIRKFWMADSVDGTCLSRRTGADRVKQVRLLVKAMLEVSKQYRIGGL